MLSYREYGINAALFNPKQVRTGYPISKKSVTLSIISLSESCFVIILYSI